MKPLHRNILLWTVTYLINDIAYICTQILTNTVVNISNKKLGFIVNKSRLEGVFTHNAKQI